MMFALGTAAKAPRNFDRIASIPRDGSWRLLQLSSVAMIMPAFEDTAEFRMEKPFTDTTLATPGVFATVSTSPLVTASVLCRDAPSGNWISTIR